MRGASPVLVSDDRCRRRFARRRVARLVALAFCQLPVGRHDRQYLGVADMFEGSFVQTRCCDQLLEARATGRREKQRYAIT